jgi:hypothetical protein
MAENPQTWSVLPHERLIEVDDGILTLTGTLHMPLMDFPRRMTVVRLRDHRLIIYNAIALDEEEMAKLERLGTPAFMIVPGVFHRRDAKIWKDRYPAMQVVAPSGVRPAAEKVVTVDASEIVVDDPDVEFFGLPGTGGLEAVLVARRPSGTTIILNDLVGNMPPSSGFAGWVRWLTGFAGDEPQFPFFAKRFIVKDKAVVKAQFEKWADDETLKRVLVSHGEPIDNPRGAFRKLARELG